MDSPVWILKIGMTLKKFFRVFLPCFAFHRHDSGRFGFNENKKNTQKKKIPSVQSEKVKSNWTMIRSKDR